MQKLEKLYEGKAKMVFRTDDPELLIVDETTTALSQSGRDIIYRIMHEMADTGKAVMIISHDLNE